MSKLLKSKFAIVVFALACTALGFGGYRFYKQKHTTKNNAATQTQGNFTNDSPSSAAATDDLVNDNDADNQTSSEDTQNSPSTPQGGKITNVDPIFSSTNKDAKKQTSVDSPISVNQEITGPMLAHITPEHCNTNCQAFANDLSLREYCEEACGISPIKDVSSCSNKKDIQKDYCLKDLAINKEDLATCDKINDANIKQACKNRIEQDTIEAQQQTNRQPDSNL